MPSDKILSFNDKELEGKILTKNPDSKRPECMSNEECREWKIEIERWDIKREDSNFGNFTTR